MLEMETLYGEIACFDSIYAKMDRNGPPSANQVISMDESRHGHAIFTLRVHHPPPPIPSFLLKRTLPEVTSQS